MRQGTEAPNLGLSRSSRQLAIMYDNIQIVGVLMVLSSGQPSEEITWKSEGGGGYLPTGVELQVIALPMN